MSSADSSTLTQTSINAIFKQCSSGDVNRLTADSRDTINEIAASCIAAFGRFFKAQKLYAKTNAKTIKGADVLAAATHIFALGQVGEDARRAASKAIDAYAKSSKGHKSARAGLNVNPTLAKRLLKGSVENRVSEDASVALAAVLECVLTNVFEIASAQSPNHTICRADIENALNTDPGLRSQFPTLMFNEDKKHFEAAKAGLSLKHACHISVNHGITGTQLKFFQHNSMKHANAGELAGGRWAIDSVAGDVKNATGKLLEHFVRVTALSAQASMEAAGRTTVLETDVISSCDTPAFKKHQWMGLVRQKHPSVVGKKPDPSIKAWRAPAFKATVAHCVNHCLGKQKGGSIRVSAMAYQKIADAAQVYIESVFAKAARLSEARQTAKGAAKMKLTVVDLAAAQEMVGCNVAPICGMPGAATQADKPAATKAAAAAAARPPSSSNTKKRSSKSSVRAKTAKAKAKALGTPKKTPASAKKAKKPAAAKAKKAAAPAPSMRRGARTRKAPARLGF